MFTAAGGCGNIFENATCSEDYWAIIKDLGVPASVVNQVLNASPALKPKRSASKKKVASRKK